VPRSPWLWALAVVASATLARPALGNPAIAVSTAGCGFDALEVERRVTQALHGDPHPGWSASVTFEAAGPRVRVIVATRENAVTQGETVLIVSSCEEALDAAVVVLALAFSAEPAQSGSVSTTELPDSPPPIVERRLPSNGEWLLRPHAPMSRPDESFADARSKIEPGASRLSLGGGLDFGTLTIPSAFLSAGIARPFSSIELRGSLRYGLPTEEERVETDLQESVRRDYGAVGVSACHGLGVNVRLLVCAGGEAALLRIARRLETRGSPGQDEDEHELSPRISGVLGAVLSPGRGFVRPELELFGAALALGRTQGGSRVALRAAAGAVVDF
jgi:hypothetical protein